MQIIYTHKEIYIYLEFNKKLLERASREVMNDLPEGNRENR